MALVRESTLVVDPDAADAMLEAIAEVTPLVAAPKKKQQEISKRFRGQEVERDVMRGLLAPQRAD